MRDFNACFEICLNQKNTGKHIFFDNQGNILLDAETNSFISSDMTIKNDAYKVYESKTSAIFISQQNEIKSNFICLKQREILRYLRDEYDLMIYSRAAQLFSWVKSYNYCSTDGTRLSSINEDLSKSCSSCQKSIFPKISPCILVAVLSDEKILLAKHLNTPFFTVLAGFVEYGETLEECVVREVHEEVGIKVHDLKYHGSQTWPFPNQLMVGFIAKAYDTEIMPDHSEIESAEWFSKSNLPTIPPKLSLSRSLIEKALNFLP